MTQKIKVCGITEANFALYAAEHGVDYLGFVFADGSPRRVTAARVSEIAAALGPLRDRVKFVGVFTTKNMDDISATAEEAGLDVVQLHGNYSALEVSAIKARGFEAWRLYSGESPGTGDRHPDQGPEDAVLLDGRVGRESRPADWSLVTPLKLSGRRVVLAGGLSAKNIAAAAATGADILDVNSSLETAPGVKSPTLLDSLLCAKGFVNESGG